MHEPPDDSEALIAVPPPEQLLAAPPTADDLPHDGVALRSVVGAKLAGAMFWHHFTLSLWIVTLGSYIKANSGSAGLGIFSAGFVGTVYGAGPIGGMIAPYITGLLADNYFATERILAVLHVAGAAALWGAVEARSETAFYVALLGYFICFIPSFALCSSMTLHHLKRPERDFPIARAWSTGGWIAGGVVVGWLWPAMTGHFIETSIVPMKLGVATQLGLAAYCLFLPHTPPTNKRAAAAPRPSFSRSATWELLRHWQFVALLLIALSAHIPSQFYYAYGNVFFNWTGMTAAAAKMTLGQMVEVGCMLLLPLVLLRVGVKTAILVGLATWTLRFLMFATAAAPSVIGRDAMLYAGILLHGVAFTLVTISLQLDVDRCAGRRRRATAQGLLSVAMSGVGCFIGAELAGWAGARWLPAEFDAANVAGWQAFWTLPAAIAGAVFLLVVLVLPRDKALESRSLDRGNSGRD